jgi:hypothetical protein
MLFLGILANITSWLNYLSLQSIEISLELISEPNAVAKLTAMVIKLLITALNVRQYLKTHFSVYVVHSQPMVKNVFKNSLRFTTFSIQNMPVTPVVR